MAKRFLSLSVHQLVDVLLRQGDIDDRVYNQETMNQGSRLHSSYQSAQGADYLSEVYLAMRVEVEEGTISLNGRADGVIDGGEYPIIDEIKTTIADVAFFAEQQEEWHLGQAVCYAYMYLNMHGGEKAGVRLTYFHQVRTDDKLIKDYVFTREELQNRVEGYVRDYFQFLALTHAHQGRRDVSAKTVPFPYQRFRKGQRELAKYVYGVATRGGALFVEAPTGIGKTMSALYPASKAYREGRLDKIFYLTAKTTGARSAAMAAKDLRASGLDLWAVQLLAKEKLCFCPGAACNPDECPFAKGYYGKLRGAIKAALATNGPFDTDFIQGHATAFELCPFEFQLDLSNHCDLIIGDYNYLFDPIVHLERYFDEAADSSTYLALIDEAHNLLDRGREMYSAALSKGLVKQAKKALKGDRYKTLRKGLNKIIERFDVLAEGQSGLFDLTGPDEALLKAIGNLKAMVNRMGKKGDLSLPSEYKEFSREANRFARICDEHYGAGYRCFGVTYKGDVLVRVYCIDPSAKLRGAIEKLKGATLFSATLSPILYHMDSLLGRTDYPYLLLSSPFPKENIKLMLAPKVSVRYKDRRQSLPEVARYLESFVAGRTGNYFLFFPSYEYMESILPELHLGDAEVLAQQRQMDPRERDEFLTHFVPNPDHTVVGLLILGGAFSEGIDMVDDRLIGVAVVGVGLPQIGKENDLIRDYHDRRSGKGFDYAYKDPGMNKVLQAVGRLIRSETDRGAALLIDDRYMQEEYRELFTRIYSEYEVVLSPEDVKDEMARFNNRGE